MISKGSSRGSSGFLDKHLALNWENNARYENIYIKNIVQASKPGEAAAGDATGAVTEIVLI